MSLKFGAMWHNFPWKILGFYGEQFGFSSVFVDEFISQCILEYDSVTNEATLHRVATHYLSRRSAHRATLEQKVK